MSSIIASNVPTAVSLEKLQEFFSFCGEVKSINPIEPGKYEVKFKNEKALSTALLLNEAELEGSPIKVEENNLPSYSEVASGKTPEVSDHKVQTAATTTGDENYDDVEQEEKPKYAIMAQLLAQGYGVSDQIIEKSISFDKTHGYSTKFNSFLQSLDQKYIHLDDPESKSSKLLSDLKGSSQMYYKKLNKYFDKLSTTSTGVKVHDFYKTLAGDVKEVHAEAKRLNELKKQDDLQAKTETVNDTITKN